VRPYLAFLGARFRVLLQYRAAAVAGLGTQLFWGLIRLMIFDAFYRSTNLPQPMSFEQVVTYVWLGQACFALLPINLEPELRELIRSGNVAYELLRPIDLYALWFSRSLAVRLAPTVLRSIPLAILAALFFGLGPPASAASGLLAALALAVGLLLAASITTLLSITLLWTLAGDGITRLGLAAVYLFSGLIIPLPLFPDWMRTFFELMPFRGLADAPFRVYMGHIPLTEIAGVFLHQSIWLALLVAAGRALMRRGLGRMVVQGG
jgi:ABC-2 type transport system permease protein